MVDEVQLTLHAHPWAPSEDTRLVIELNRYDVPLLGVIQQGRALFLFHCLAGELEPEQVWLYAPVSEAEVNQLVELHEPEETQSWIDGIEQDRAVTLAHAHEEVGILASVSDVRLGNVRSLELRRAALLQLAAQLQAHAAGLRRLSATAS